MNVYAIKIDTSLNDINSFIPLLSEERIKKINKYIYENARKISILSEILVKYTLYKEYRFSPHFIIFEYNEFGKPFLKDCKDIFFNISHSGNRVALAFVKEKKIGVDIERMNSLDDYSQIAKNFFLPPESERICAQTDAAKGMEKFYEIWTVKEAFVKALGHGLSRSLKSFEVLEQGTINDYTNNSRYNYYTKQLSDNYLCSLVVV